MTFTLTVVQIPHERKNNMVYICTGRERALFLIKNETTISAIEFILF